MKKANIVFKNSNTNGVYNIPVVELHIKFLEDKRITLFTNLIQWFIYIGDDPNGFSVVPMDDFITRPFSVNGYKVVEFDDIMYRIKYLFNNGQYSYDLAAFANRIETAIHNSKVKPEFIDKVFKMLNEKQ